VTEDEQKIQDEAIAYAKKHKHARCAELTDVNLYPPEELPVSVFMAGSPGAGKTESAKEIIAELEKRHPEAPKVLRIDPDDLRHEFPGYSGANSWLFQHATSIWVDRIHDLALDQSQTFLLDSTLSNLQRARSECAAKPQTGQPNDQTVKLVQQGIDRIDTHVPERFSRGQLEAALGVKRG
jgi:hypothetical protein